VSRATSLAQTRRRRRPARRVTRPSDQQLSNTYVAINIELVFVANCSQANQAKTEAQKAEQKLDQYSVEARKKYEEAKIQAEKEFASTRQEVNAAVNKFDQKTLEATKETKSWFGSWFK
jgi:heat shock protein HslJ